MNALSRVFGALINSPRTTLPPPSMEPPNLAMGRKSFAAVPAASRRRVDIAHQSIVGVLRFRAEKTGAAAGERSVRGDAHAADGLQLPDIVNRPRIRRRSVRAAQSQIDLDRRAADGDRSRRPIVRIDDSPIHLARRDILDKYQSRRAVDIRRRRRQQRPAGKTAKAPPM